MNELNEMLVQTMTQRMTEVTTQTIENRDDACPCDLSNTDSIIETILSGSIARNNLYFPIYRQGRFKTEQACVAHLSPFLPTHCIHHIRFFFRMLLFTCKN